MTDFDTYLEPVEWNMIYNSTPESTYARMGTYERTTCTNWPATIGPTQIKVTSNFTNTVGTNNIGLYANCIETTGGTSWVRIDNGLQHLGNPCNTCNTTVVEWAWAAQGEHACTTNYRVGTLEAIRNGYIYPKPETPEEQIQKIIRSRCGPNVIVRNNQKRKSLTIPNDVREQRARETLRRVIGEKKFINFIKHGFISVKSKSGLIYQIFPGHGITHVFNQGNLVERLCVVLQGNFPPTDSLIMRYLLILNNENQFRSLAVKHSINGFQNESKLQDNPTAIKPLAEIFRELKKVA